MKKLTNIILLFLFFIFISGCNVKTTEKISKEYKPIIKENLVFDTEMLFNNNPEIYQGLDGEYKNDYGVTKAIFYDGPKYQNRDTKVFAYIGYPNSEMPSDGYPGIVLVHGGGGCAFPEWVEYWNSKGYVAIAIDTYAQQYGNKTYDGKGAPKNPDGGPTESGSFSYTKDNYEDS